MKKSLSVLALALIAAAFAGSAHAADKGFYAGANLGRANSSISGLTSMTSDTGVSFVGGYQFTPYVAAEVSYNVLGNVVESAANPGNIALKGVSASVVGLYPINDRYTVLGRLGVSQTSMSVPGMSSIGRTALSYGVAGQYKVDEKVAVRVSYDIYSVGDTVNVPIGHTAFLSTGVIFKF